MEACENTERRYNTRFRGVPRSIFTYPRIGRKPGPKSDTSSVAKNEVRDNFVYSRLGKKPGPKSCGTSSEPNDVKDEGQQTQSKAGRKPAPRAYSTNALPNGLHYTKAESCDLPSVKTEEEEKKDPETNTTEPASSTPNDASTSSKSLWILSKEKLSWNNSNVASYNPKTKMFRCVVCQAVGFMSRIGEHYLGTHCNAKVFHCPQCTYCSAWWRCVRNHMSKNHGVFNAPASMWKNQPLLDEIMQILQNLKYSVDCQDRVIRVAENSGKRYICPKCPYATDRRDLYNRHENIHREEKPFQCYICYKLFNRADHVKKHFCRIHKDYNYDINLIRRLPSKRSRIPVSPSYNGLTSSTSSQITSGSSSMTKPSNSISLSQSTLLNCLTGSPTMSSAVNNEISLPSSQVKSEVEPRSHSMSNMSQIPTSQINLMNFLTQSTILQKTLEPQSHVMSTVMDTSNHSQHTIAKHEDFKILENNEPKKFHCSYCSWKGLDMWTLRLHLSSHFKTFTCVLCDFKAPQEKDLEAHLWDIHKKRSCNKCSFLADSLIILDAHLKEIHGSRNRFMCRHCSQAFEVRSDMEAHCIFIHNQVLLECKQDACDFCTTDPGILESHRQEKHGVSPVSQETEETKSASDTLCLYCGCEFADSHSLQIHLELFHENPLQLSSRRPLDPYCCTVCGYSTPTQQMMMEHMRIHTGQVLHCQAGDGCYFRTPYDTVLREHVLQIHSIDDGIIRCLHCGYRCSTRYSFVYHYQENHHPFTCQLCEEVEYKHFTFIGSSFNPNSSITALIPFTKQYRPSQKMTGDNKCHLKSTQSKHMPNVANILISGDAVRRSRKQSQPRKVVQGSQQVEHASGDCNLTPIVEDCHNAVNRVNNFISLYAKKVRRLAQTPLLRCKFCIRSPLYFRHRRNYILHTQWHYLKKHHCSKCIQTFRHHYQVLLHQRREHKQDLMS